MTRVKIKTLKDLRKSKGIMAGYVAERLGISRPTLTAKESLKSAVSVLEAQMLSTIYDTDIDEIEKLCRVKH